MALCLEAFYERWLVAGPVDRLRLRPGDVLLPVDFQRVEQRGVSMLLAACPEMIKRDLVASRTLTSTGILFRMFTCISLVVEWKRQHFSSR